MLCRYVSVFPYCKQMMMMDCTVLVENHWHSLQMMMDFTVLVENHWHSLQKRFQSFKPPLSYLDTACLMLLPRSPPSLFPVTWGICSRCPPHPPPALRDSRINLHHSTANELSITIADVQMADEGEYTCSIFTMPVLTATATVTVLGG